MLPRLSGGARDGNSVRAARTPPGSPQVSTAVASTALAAVLDGPVTRCTVLAAGPRALTVHVGTASVRVLSVVTREAVRLPCALVVGDGTVPLAGVEPGAAVLVGGGAVRLADLREIRPGRWWDPRPRIGARRPGLLATNLAVAEAWLPHWPGEGVQGVRACLGAAAAGLEAAASAVLDGDVGGSTSLAAAVAGLVGLGPGSTPSGDDFLAGALAAARLFGHALGAGAAVALADALEAATRGLLGRTTVLSAALLEHAGRAEMCAPAAVLCRALAGQGPVVPALAGLLAVGHTSGADLAAGICCGARLSLRSARAGAVARL